jgi:hypothetical protein
MRQKSIDFAIVSLLHRNNCIARRTRSINPPLHTNSYKEKKYSSFSQVYQFFLKIKGEIVKIHVSSFLANFHSKHPQKQAY